LKGRACPGSVLFTAQPPDRARVNVTVTAMPAGHGSLSHGSLARCFTRAAAAGRSRPGRRRHSDGDCHGDRGRDTAMTGPDRDSPSRSHGPGRGPTRSQPGLPVRVNLAGKYDSTIARLTRNGSQSLRLTKLSVLVGGSVSPAAAAAAALSESATRSGDWHIRADRPSPTATVPGPHVCSH
jgi:hypothetical protein